jgi:hypothetical protein
VYHIDRSATVISADARFDLHCCFPAAIGVSDIANLGLLHHCQFPDEHKRMTGEKVTGFG